MGSDGRFTQYSLEQVHDQDTAGYAKHSPELLYIQYLAICWHIYKTLHLSQLANKFSDQSKRLHFAPSDEHTKEIRRASSCLAKST